VSWFEYKPPPLTNPKQKDWQVNCGKQLEKEEDYLYSKGVEHGEVPPIFLGCHQSSGKIC